ncbi:MAG: hypothetical protein L3K08_03090, partial [Thermoplasmata archaeon]|nr:hypothetical protein [Thermoplasmata archaeon]
RDGVSGVPGCRNGGPLPAAVELRPPTYFNDSGVSNYSMVVAAVNSTVELQYAIYDVQNPDRTPFTGFTDLILRAANGTFLGDANSQSGGTWNTGSLLNLSAGETLTLQASMPLHGETFLLLGETPYSESISFVLP